jgi:VanZ family protein
MKNPTSSAPRFPWILATIGFLGILAMILWFAYQGALPPILTQNDKPAHLILYGIATFLGHRALSRRHIRCWGWPIPLFPALFTLFTLGEELAQKLSPNRTLDAMDLVASLAGIAIGYGLANWRKG